MSCHPSHSPASRQIEVQSWPTTGLLHNNLNLSLKELKARLLKIETGNALIYWYVIRTIKNKDGTFVQTGCGPNFEGDVITLCTCKHHMRTYRKIDSWENEWIAGFSGVGAGEGKNVLIYLMQVGQAFESQYNLWDSGVLSKKELRAKNSQFNKLGDLYKPKESSLKEDQRFQVKNYQVPHQDHAHFKKEKWHKDIFYPDRWNRRPVLLVGDRKHSFLWSRPTISLPKGNVGQGERKGNLSEFLEALNKGVKYAKSSTFTSRD